MRKKICLLFLMICSMISLKLDFSSSSSFFIFGNDCYIVDDHGVHGEMKVNVSST